MPNASGLRTMSGDGELVAEFAAAGSGFSSSSVQRTLMRPCSGNAAGFGKLTESSNASPRFNAKRFSHGRENCSVALKRNGLPGAVDGCQAASLCLLQISALPIPRHKTTRTKRQRLR